MYLYRPTSLGTCERILLVMVWRDNGLLSSYKLELCVESREGNHVLAGNSRSATHCDSNFLESSCKVNCEVLGCRRVVAEVAGWSGYRDVDGARAYT